MKYIDSSSVTIIEKQPEIFPTAQNACLIMLYPHGQDLGRRYTLEAQQKVLLGRAKDATIQIDQNSVSREHAIIRVLRDDFYVEDLGSTNNTFVNEEPIQGKGRIKLRDGDRIQIGGVIFKFLSEANLENIFHEELYRLATTDGLTMIYNKRFFLDTIERELSRAKRHQRPLSLIMMDVDFFKKINDEHGHLAGDQILKVVAQLIQQNVRMEDIFSRYGGEEFALLLPETDYYQAKNMAEKLRKLIEEKTVVFDGIELKVTMSMGVAFTNIQTEGTNSLIQTADSHLYQAKNSGRNRVCG